MRMRTFSALVLCFVLVVTPTVSSADCTWIYHVDTDPELVCTYGSYYTVYTSEPNWCDFAPGDWVYVRWQVVGGYLTLTGYYVIPAADTTSHPPQDFGQYPQDVVGENCNLIWLPW